MAKFAQEPPVEVIVVPEIVTFALFVAQRQFAPFAFVVIEPPVISTSPPWTKTAAFTP